MHDSVIVAIASGHLPARVDAGARGKGKAADRERKALGSLSDEPTRWVEGVVE